MLKNWRIVATVLAAFVIVNSIPVGFVYWKVAEWRLPQIRAESLAHATPFESIPRSQWVGETANTSPSTKKRSHLIPMLLQVSVDTRVQVGDVLRVLLPIRNAATYIAATLSNATINDEINGSFDCNDMRHVA